MKTKTTHTAYNYCRTHNFCLGGRFNLSYFIPLLLLAMEWNPKEVTIIYNFEDRQGREAVAYGKEIAENVREVDISKDPLTERQMAELLMKLDLKVEDIIDRTSAIYQDKYEGADMEEQDWLGVLKRNPELMKTPIGILGNRAVICENPNDILKLDDGQGFDQNMKV